MNPETVVLVSLGLAAVLIVLGVIVLAVCAVIAGARADEWILEEWRDE